MTVQTIDTALKLPVNLMGKEFINDKQKYYRWLHANERVHKGKMSLLPVYMVHRYDDCVSLLKDPRVVRNRTTATGGRPFPVPLPKAVNMLMKSMITEDDPNHRRLRTLVHKAFTPRRLAYLDQRIETLTHELLDKAEAQGEVDLMEAYALPIPVTVISEMVGVTPEETPQFAGYMGALATGMTGFKIAKTMFYDLPKAVRFCRELIERKRANPQDDILTGLIEAEENGDKLTEDELIAMVFLIIVAGYETTVHLITNVVQTLLTHPEQLAQLRAEPGLMETAIEEVLRYNGPILSTKPAYGMEDLHYGNQVIPKGKMILPLLGAANFDPDIFEDPYIFDITREKNRHLGFGQGIHYWSRRTACPHRDAHRHQKPARPQSQFTACNSRA